jgi:hypothetical protein
MRRFAGGRILYWKIRIRFSSAPSTTMHSAYLIATALALACVRPNPCVAAATVPPPAVRNAGIPS